MPGLPGAVLCLYLCSIKLHWAQLRLWHAPLHCDLWCRETVPLSAVHSSKCTMCILQLFLVSDHIFRNSIVNCNVDNIYNFIYFQCAKIIKETMEEKYGGMGKWQVVIGESFGVDITYDTESLFYMYFVGTVACFVWKCSRSWGIITTCKTFLCAAILSCIRDYEKYYNDIMWWSNTV